MADGTQYAKISALPEKAAFADTDELEISGAVADGRQSYRTSGAKIGAASVAKVNALKGGAGGIAPLNNDAKVPLENLPAEDLQKVDDVVDGAGASFVDEEKVARIPDAGEGNNGLMTKEMVTALLGALQKISGSSEFFNEADGGGLVFKDSEGREVAGICLNGNVPQLYVHRYTNGELSSRVLVETHGDGLYVSTVLSGTDWVKIPDTGEVNALIASAIGGIESFGFAGPYDTTEDITNPDNQHIYLIGTVTPYTEYCYINGVFEVIGSAEIDLTNYYTKSETDAETGEAVDEGIAAHNEDTSAHDDIRSEVSAKQPKIAAAADAPLLTAPATAGAAPGTVPQNTFAGRDYVDSGAPNMIPANILANLKQFGIRNANAHNGLLAYLQSIPGAMMVRGVLAFDTAEGYKTHTVTLTNLAGGSNTVVVKIVTKDTAAYTTFPQLAAALYATGLDASMAVNSLLPYTTTGSGTGNRYFSTDGTLFCSDSFPSGTTSGTVSDTVTASTGLEIGKYYNLPNQYLAAPGNGWSGHIRFYGGTYVHVETVTDGNVAGADMEQVCRLKYYAANGALFVSGDFDPKTGYDIGVASSNVRTLPVTMASSSVITGSLYCKCDVATRNSILYNNDALMLVAAVAAGAQTVIGTITGGTPTVTRAQLNVYTSGLVFITSGIVRINEDGKIQAGFWGQAIPAGSIIFVNVSLQITPSS